MREGVREEGEEGEEGLRMRTAICCSPVTHTLAP